MHHLLTIKYWVSTFLSEGLNSHRSHPKEKSGQRALDPTPKRNLVKEPWIPPRREIWSKSPGSHPKENLGRESERTRWLTNPDWTWRIPPRRKFRVGKQDGGKKWRWPRPKKVDFGLRSTLRSWPQSSPPPQQQQQQLSPFYDLSASPQVKIHISCVSVLPCYIHGERKSWFDSNLSRKRVLPHFCGQSWAHTYPPCRDKKIVHLQKNCLLGVTAEISLLNLNTLIAAPDKHTAEVLLE